MKAESILGLRGILKSHFKFAIRNGCRPRFNTPSIRRMLRRIERLLLYFCRIEINRVVYTKHGVILLENFDKWVADLSIVLQEEDVLVTVVFHTGVILLNHLKSCYQYGHYCFAIKSSRNLLYRHYNNANSISLWALRLLRTQDQFRQGSESKISPGKASSYGGKATENR